MHQNEDSPNRSIASAFFPRLTFLLLACLFVFYSFSFQARATSGDRDETMEQATRYVYPMGQTVGIKLFSDGVLVVGLSEITTDSGHSSPAKSCGLQEGDIITHINNEEVNTIEEVQAVLQELAGGEMNMQIRRDEASSQLKTQAVQCSSDGVYKLGAWIRDSMAGIGTLTFYDPDSKIFGALGHGINDIDTTMLMPLQSGSIMPSTVAKIRKGLSGQPGELSGKFQVSEDLGALYANTEGGVFGTSDGEHFGSSQALVAVAKKAEVSLGAVTIHNVYPFYYARFGIFQSPTEFFSYPLREGAGHRSQGTQYRKSPSPKRDHSLQ